MQPHVSGGVTLDLPEQHPPEDFRNLASIFFLW